MKDSQKKVSSWAMAIEFSEIGTLFLNLAQSTPPFLVLNLIVYCPFEKPRSPVTRKYYWLCDKARSRGVKEPQVVLVNSL